MSLKIIAAMGLAVSVSGFLLGLLMAMGEAETARHRKDEDDQ